MIVSGRFQGGTNENLHIYDAFFTSDTRLVTVNVGMDAGIDAGIQHWDVESGTLLHVDARKWDRWVTVTAHTPDGRLLAHSSTNLLVVERLNDQGFFEPAHQFQLLHRVSSSIALSQDGRTAAVLSMKGIDVYDVESGRHLYLLRLPKTDFVRKTELVFSPDSTRLLTQIGTEINLWHLASGRRLLVLKMPERGFNHRNLKPAFNWMGDRIYALSSGSLQFWTAAAQQK